MAQVTIETIKNGPYIVKGEVELIDADGVDLMSLMFPGFRGEALIDSSDLPDVTRSRIKRLHHLMKPEIAKTIAEDPLSNAAQAKAENILTWFMSQLGQLRKVLWT